MKIFLSILALLSSTSVVMAQPPTTVISLVDVPDGDGDFSSWEPGEDPITEVEVENSVIESWRYPTGKYLSDMEKHWWISRAYFKIAHKHAKLCVVHGQGGKEHYPVVEVYKETSGPDDDSPNYSCPSQRRPHQHIDDVNTMLEGVLGEDPPAYLTLKYKKTKPWGYYDDVHGLSLTCWIIKINENIVDSDVYKDPNEGGVQNYDYDKDRPFASFCFRIILQNNNDFLPYHPIDAAEDRDGGRYLQDTAETPDTGDSLGIPPPPPPVYEAPNDNMDITYCDTGITIYFDLKADFWVRGFKTQAMNPDDLQDEVHFKLRAYVGKCFGDWEKVHQELDYYEQLPSLEDAETQEDQDEGEGDEGGRRLRRLQEETVVDSYSRGFYRKFWQKEEVPLCICTKKHSLAFIDHIKNLRFVGKRKGLIFAEQTVVWGGQKVQKLVSVDCNKHYGKCCEVKVILNEDFYQGDTYKSTLYVHAHGDAWMQVGEKDDYGEAPVSRRLVQASFGGRNLQELEAPADGSAGEAEFEAVAELQASGSFAMVGGSALGAIASMIVAVLFV